VNQNSRDPLEGLLVPRHLRWDDPQAAVMPAWMPFSRCWTLLLAAWDRWKALFVG
jgi:hypothetical protein